MVVKSGAGTININDTGYRAEDQGGGWEINNGTMLLNGNPTYDNRTNGSDITGSGLEIDNVATTSLSNAQTYATLGGNGTTAVAIKADGANSSITPGDPTVNGGIGTLTLNGGLTAIDGLTLNFVLNAAGESSLLDVPDLNLNGTVQVNLTTLDSVATDESYLLVSGGSGANWTLGNDLSFDFSAPAGYTVESYNLDSTGDTLSVQFGSVPEPSTWALVSFGTLLLIGSARFRKLRA